MRLKFHILIEIKDKITCRDNIEHIGPQFSTPEDGHFYRCFGITRKSGCNLLDPASTLYAGIVQQDAQPQTCEFVDHNASPAKLTAVQFLYYRSELLHLKIYKK
jgi:hypothetical protein